MRWTRRFVCCGAPPSPEGQIVPYWSIIDSSIYETVSSHSNALVTFQRSAPDPSTDTRASTRFHAKVVSANIAHTRVGILIHRQVLLTTHTAFPTAQSAKGMEAVFLNGDKGRPFTVKLLPQRLFITNPDLDLTIIACQEAPSTSQPLTLNPKRQTSISLAISDALDLGHDVIIMGICQTPNVSDPESIPGTVPTAKPAGKSVPVSASRNEGGKFPVVRLGTGVITREGTNVVDFGEVKEVVYGQASGSFTAGSISARQQRKLTSVGSKRSGQGFFELVPEKKTMTSDWALGSAGFDAMGKINFVVCNPQWPPETPRVSVARQKGSHVPQRGVTVLGILEWLKEKGLSNINDPHPPPPPQGVAGGRRASIESADSYQVFQNFFKTL